LKDFAFTHLRALTRVSRSDLNQSDNHDQSFHSRLITSLIYAEFTRKNGELKLKEGMCLHVLSYGDWKCIG